MMSDDSETMEDTKKGSLAEVTDDLCTLEYIEIVPLERPSDDYRRPEFIYPFFVVKLEDLDEIKQEPADENDNGGSHCYVNPALADECESDAAQCIIKVSFLRNYIILYYSQKFCVLYNARCNKGL